MEQFYLLDYLKEKTKIDKSKLDILKYELDRSIYYYGEHFKNPKEQLLSQKLIIKSFIKSILKDMYIFYHIFKNKKELRKNIISNAYFSVNDELIKKGFNVLRPMHNTIGNKFIASNFKTYKSFLKVNCKIKSGNFNDLISEDFFKKIDLFTDELTDYYRSINASSLIVHSDLPFFEQINIGIFKRLQKPSFLFSHGLPSNYNIYDQNQTDYLIVWGKKMKEQYIKIGFNSDKILISGHPFYKKLHDNKLRNSLDNILILSKSLSGAQFRDKTVLSDRGNSILYLYSIEKILKSFDVKKVRLRVHPADNIKWFYKFISRDFFIDDSESLKNSLEKSSLVIGPTSTVFLESVYYGVNYLIYEPTVNDIDLINWNLVPPFDGSNDKALVAKDEETLEQMLKERVVIDSSIFHDYIDTPFDISCVTNRIV